MSRLYVRLALGTVGGFTIGIGAGIGFGYLTTTQLVSKIGLNSAVGCGVLVTALTTAVVGLMMKSLFAPSHATTICLGARDIQSAYHRAAVADPAIVPAASIVGALAYSLEQAMSGGFGRGGF
jgi:hypothetical protein